MILSRRHKTEHRHRALRLVGYVVMLVLGGLSVLILALNPWIPTLYGVGTGISSVLPWFGATIVLTLILAIVLRSFAGLALTVIAAIIWLALFLPLFTHRSAATGSLRVATQNIGSNNTQAAAAATQLMHAGAQIIAVEKLSSLTRPAVNQALDPSYPYQQEIGTVGLWSKYPLSGYQPVNIGIGWTRAFSVEVSSPEGAIKVYVSHLASARLGNVAERDKTLRALAGYVNHDAAARILILGDFNTASTDPQLKQFSPKFRDAQLVAGNGFGFTWPASFPLTRPDHILFNKGLRAVSAGTLQTVGSQHRAALASFD